MTATAATDSRFRLSPDAARDLAARFGTPLYVLDEAHFRARIQRYVAAFRAVAARSELSFASKANSSLAVMGIAHQEGCTVDVASEGEFRAALAAGVPASRCYFHGNNKSLSELEFALDNGIGHLVVDHFGEIEMLAEIAGARASRPPLPSGEAGETPARRQFTSLVLRLAPGVDPITHAKISTGQADTKFGFNIGDGSAEKATLRCLELSLPLVGFHCHVGSQLLDPGAQRSGGELIARFAVEMKERLGFSASYLNVGGGLGVRYTDADQPMDLERYCELVVQAVRRVLDGSGLDPVLGQEPGRALISESGVTLYRVGVIKTVPSGTGKTRTYVCVDGGLSDNPRPALYGSRYTVERVSADRGQDARGTNAESGDAAVTVSGKHCETDALFPDVLLPSNMAAGDLLQVLCTGAYNSSMASNYNRFPRPATALIRENGGVDLIQRRETWDEMLAREILPEGLG